MPAEHEALDLKEQIDTMIQDGLERIVELYASHNAKSDGIRKKIDERTRVAEEKAEFMRAEVALYLIYF